MLRESQKRRIRQVARQHGISAALELANELLQGSGVECIWGYADPYSLREAPDLEYVNLGDPYVPTVIYDRVTRRFLWGESWGNIVERRGYER